MNNHCENFDNLTLNQKLCLLLSKNLNPKGNTVSGQGVISYMDKLLKDGANLNFKDEYGKTPLDIALSHRNATSVLWLVESGAADHLDKSQKLCVLLSTKHSLLDKSFKLTLEKLLQEGANINYMDCFGKTPLKIAIGQGNAETAIWLTENGAKKIDAADKDFFNSQLANHIVYHNYNIDSFDKPFFEALLKQGATVKSSVISKILENTSLSTFTGSKLGDLIHKEVDSNLENCTIHKFVLFKHLESIPGFFSPKELLEIDYTLKDDFLTLIGLSPSPVITIQGGDGKFSEITLPNLVTANIARHVDIEEWLQVVGQAEQDWHE